MVCSHPVLLSLSATDNRSIKMFKPDDDVTKSLKQFLSSLVSSRHVNATNELCNLIGIDADKIRYKRNSRYLVADRLHLGGLREELERIKWSQVHPFLRRIV
jgi:hypothetical protein